MVLRRPSELSHTAREFFVAAIHRAAGASARYLGEIAVEPGSNGDWRIEIEIPGRPAITLRCTAGDGPVFRRGQVLGWSFEGDDVGVAAKRLCERLAADPTPVPAALRELIDPARLELPIEVELIHLPGDCDRACVFCGDNYTRASALFDPASLVRRPPTTPQRPLSPELEQQLRALAARREWLRLAWSGSDCLSSPFFEAALDLAHELGFTGMWLQSPGTRLSEPGVIDGLVRRGIVRVQLTAHAHSEALFDAIGGKSGAHALFWGALERLKRARVEIGVTIPITPFNLDEIPPLVARLVPEPTTIEMFVWHADPGLALAYDVLPLRLDALAPMLEAVARIAAPGRVSVDGIPACKRPRALAGHFIWGPTQHHAGERAHPRGCGPCLARADCEGLPAAYAERHPDVVPLLDPDDPRVRTRDLATDLRG